MSEDYYSYDENENVDLTKNEIYDFVVEREKLKEIEGSGYKSVNSSSEGWKIEGFENLSSFLSMKNIIIIVIIIVLIYFLYTKFSKSKN